MATTMDSRMTPSSRRTKTFHPFPRLPCEIRHMIWKLAIKQKRKVAIYLERGLVEPIPRRDEPETPWAFARSLRREQRRAAPWPLLHACEESRYLALPFRVTVSVTAAVFERDLSNWSQRAWPPIPMPDPTLALAGRTQTYVIAAHDALELLIDLKNCPRDFACFNWPDIRTTASFAGGAGAEQVQDRGWSEWKRWRGVEAPVRAYRWGTKKGMFATWASSIYERPTWGYRIRGPSKHTPRARRLARAEWPALPSIPPPRHEWGSYMPPWPLTGRIDKGKQRQDEEPYGIWGDVGW